MLERERKHRISVDGNRTFIANDKVTREVEALLRKRGALPVKEETVPASEVFSGLDAKYTRPGVALRGARHREGLTQAQLAAKLNIEQGDLSKMENGKRVIGKDMAKRLGEVLNINYRVFL